MRVCLYDNKRDVLSICGVREWYGHCYNCLFSEEFICKNKNVFIPLVSLHISSPSFQSLNLMCLSLFFVLSYCSHSKNPNDTMSLIPYTRLHWSSVHIISQHNPFFHFSLSAQLLIREKIAFQHVLSLLCGKTQGASAPAGSPEVSPLFFILG